MIVWEVAYLGRGCECLLKPFALRARNSTMNLELSTAADDRYVGVGAIKEKLVGRSAYRRSAEVIHGVCLFSVHFFRMIAEVSLRRKIQRGINVRRRNIVLSHVERMKEFQ